MSGVTDNYGFILPAEGEAYDVDILNGNFIQADTKIKDREKQSGGMLNNVDNTATSTGLSSTGVMCDLIPVSLIADRWYEATYRVKTLVPSAADIAVVVELRKSVTTDSSATGTAVSEAYTVWTSPIANTGSSHLVVVSWKAGATETVNIKAVMARATGSATYDISARHLNVKDLGARFV
jgi:hypothetical protein